MNLVVGVDALDDPNHSDTYHSNAEQIQHFRRVRRLRRTVTHPFDVTSREANPFLRRDDHRSSENDGRFYIEIV